MNFLVSGKTDIGLTKSTNQDSLTVKMFNTRQGRMVFCVLCDGMGGLAKGEVASASVINAFDVWSKTELKSLCESRIDENIIRSHWERIANEQNKKIMNYGKRLGIRLGTTITAMLLTQERYFIFNIGDTRAYEIYNDVRQITKDHTLVAQEIALGKLTPEQAKNDPRRSVLLQCIGASDSIYPDLFVGEAKINAVYMLCCDGFRHEITPAEMYEKYQPARLLNVDMLDQASLSLIELNKQRRERDNITVAVVRTF